MRRSFLFSAPVIAIAALSTCGLVELPIADACTRAVYFGTEKQDTNSPGALWVKLDKIDFEDGSGVRKLTIVGKPDTTRDQTTNFEKSEPFKFLAPH